MGALILLFIALSFFLTLCFALVVHKFTHFNAGELGRYPLLRDVVLLHLLDHLVECRDGFNLREDELLNHAKVSNAAKVHDVAVLGDWNGGDVQFVRGLDVPRAGHMLSFVEGLGGLQSEWETTDVNLSGNGVVGGVDLDVCHDWLVDESVSHEG